MEKNTQNANTKDMVVVDPEVAKMIELIGGQKGRALSTEVYAKSVMLQSKAHEAMATNLANRIIAEVAERQDKTTTEIEASMRVTKACYDATKRDLDAGFAETQKAIKDIKTSIKTSKSLAIWAWLVPILIAIFTGLVICGVALKMEPLMCVLLGASAGALAFIVTFLIDQYGKEGETNNEE